MREFIRPGDVAVEIGAGAGLSPRYLERKIILTDVVANDWLDLAMDGTAIAVHDESVDVIIVSNALHHFAYPAVFLNEASRVLKDDGLILINDAYCSLLLRAILRIARHEGYSYDVDVFDPQTVANDPKDPWSGNNAVSNLLFDSREQFESRFPHLRILSDTPSESLSFIASGGVTAKLPVPELPRRLLDLIAWLDELVVKAAPSLFALSRRTILKKTRPGKPAQADQSPSDRQEPSPRIPRQL